MKKILIPVLVLLGLSSCSNYYKVVTASEPKNAAIYNNFGDSSKYYILRNMNDAFVMKNISISTDRKNVQCTLDELPFDHKLYINNGAAGKMKYKTKNTTDDDEAGVLNEVHIYLVPGNKTETGAYTLALQNIEKAEIIEKDKIKTKKSHVTGTVIGVSSAVVFVGAVVAIIAASSPLSFSLY